MKSPRKALSRLSHQARQSTGSLAHTRTGWKATAYRGILGVLMALGMIGGGLISPQMAQAAPNSGIGGGGCGVYLTHQDGPWHTSLCLWGPYADSHGNLYYQASATCWVDAIAQQWPYDYTYSLACSRLNGSNLTSGQTTYTYQTGYTPQPARIYTFPTYNVYKSVQTSIWVNNAAFIMRDTPDDVVSKPTNGAWTVYTP